MAEREIARMTVEDFAAWEREREERYELVDGLPMAMTGGTEAHDQVRLAVASEFRRQLRGKPCRAVLDVKLICPSGNVRYPDVQVNCRPLDPRSTSIAGATIVCEVLSDSTRATDFLVKLQDYQSVPSIRAYAIFWQDLPKAVVFRRAGAVLQKAEEPEGMDAAIEFPEVGADLRFADLFDWLAAAVPDEAAGAPA